MRVDLRAKTTTMTYEKKQTEWESFASTWIKRCREGDPNRDGMLDRWMLDVLGPVNGLKIADLGCGEGRFCRILAQHGASHVLGVDLCEPLVAEARKRRCSDAEDCLVSNMESLDPVEREAFDIAISYVSLVDVENLEAEIMASYRIIKPGGRFVVCNLAPMATSTNSRITDPDGSRMAFRVDRYFDESARIMPFRGHPLTNFHRTLATYINSFLEAGYALRGIWEPKPDEQEVARYPDLENELRAPSFVIFDLRKPRIKRSKTTASGLPE